MYAQVEKTNENRSRTAANSIAQKKGDVRQDFGFVDNRQKALTQRRVQEIMRTKALNDSVNPDKTGALNTGNLPSGEHTIQRMVALAINNKDTEDDMVIMTNLKYALSYAKGPVVDFRPGVDFSGMKEGEDLMILEHGSPGKIQQYGANQIAEILTAEGKAMPDHIAGIIVLACSAGLPETTGDDTTTLVSIIASSLSKKGINLVVDGKRGLALTSPATGERAVKPEKKDEYMKLQHATVIKYGFAGKTKDLTKPGYQHHIPKYGPIIVTELKKASVILQEDYDKDSSPYTKPPSKMTLEEKATHMARITRPFYEELVGLADSNGFLYAEFEGEQYALGSLIMNL